MKKKAEILLGTLLVGSGGAVAEFYSFKGNPIPVALGLATLAAGARISENGVNVAEIGERKSQFLKSDLPVQKIILSVIGLGLLTQGSVFLGQSIVVEQVVKSFGGAALMFFGFVALHYSLKGVLV